jgi:hypothetical protein
MKISVTQEELALIRLAMEITKEDDTEFQGQEVTPELLIEFAVYFTANTIRKNLLGNLEE